MHGFHNAKRRQNSDIMTNKYPIYIISKGRFDTRKTVKTLTKMSVDFQIVIEKQEFEQYSKHIDKDKIIVLPFSNLGHGSIPARNFVFEHSIKSGFSHHWILDDNIESIERFNNNMKIRVECPSPFCVLENFIDRYENVAQVGMNYAIFCPDSERRPPIRFNTRIYSCMLIKNNIPFRWRGKFNEDTDLSLRILKSGLCTVLFNTFLIGKRATMTMSGGNEQIYNDTNNRREFAESLQQQHPDVCRVVWRFNRWHHHVNYKPFKNNKLIKKKGLTIPSCVNNYGMKLIKIKS